MVESPKELSFSIQLNICTIQKFWTSLYGNLSVYEEFKKLPIKVY
jgi:hypothetical protein